MQITLPVATLSKELALLFGACDRKTTIPVLGCVLIQAQRAELPGEASTVTLTTSDLELSLRVTMDADVKESGAAAIPVKRLMDYMKLLDGEHVTIKGTAGWVNVQCGKSKTRMATMDAGGFPEMPAAPDEYRELPARPFAAAISRVQFGISKEAGRFVLNGALMELQAGGTARLVTTDGHRLCLADFAGGAGTAEKTLIGQHALRELVKLADLAQLGEAFQYSRSDSGLFFRLGSRLLLSRALAGSFPEYERVLPKAHPHSATAPRQSFSKAITRAALFADDRTRAVRLRISEDAVTLTAAQADCGESEETVDATVTGSGMETGFNGGYLLDFLGAAGTDKVQLQYKDAKSAMTLRPIVEGEEAQHAGRYECVLMPMMV